MCDIPTVDEIESWLGSSLPSEYRAFLDTCPVELTASDLVLLYGRSILIERNETYETRKYCPGFVSVGNDSGGREIVMSLQDSTIYLVGSGSMQMDAAEPLSTDFSTWRQAGCPLPECELDRKSWPAHPLDYVNIYINRRPEKLSSLLAVKRVLKTDTSIGDLKRGLDHLPVLALASVTYAVAQILCQKVNQFDCCVEIRAAGPTSTVLPIEEASE